MEKVDSKITLFFRPLLPFPNEFKIGLCVVVLFLILSGVLYAFSLLLGGFGRICMWVIFSNIIRQMFS